ncbi:hypothetical protein Pint_05494 [Pistacia integerrima]|uniref:Uncharacterized protein n=1 Tax=Pistacia integerrima TaxID=434235 RepID=A0ACC0Z7C8_9ROSI|nr:hypothetical protein Pint_05494 [Pistacia integerrima]
MIGRALISVLWGVVADYYGRKPVILYWTISVVVLSTLFGLSINFWMAVITRFLLGIPVRNFYHYQAYATEVMREEHQALGLSAVSEYSMGHRTHHGPSSGWFVGLAWYLSFGIIFTIQPADKYPNIFSKESLFG